MTRRKYNVKLTKEERRCLVSSIRHWERMCDKGSQCKDEPSSYDCALCRLDNRRVNRLRDRGEMASVCVRCPVCRVTGEVQCYRTPFYEAEMGWRHFGPDSPEFRKHARREIRFLKNILKASDKQAQK